MKQDINKIINVISQEFVKIQMEDKKKIAILVEENERLRSELNNVDGSPEQKVERLIDDAE